MLTSILCLIAAAGSHSPAASPVFGAQERVVSVQLLDNGFFTQTDVQVTDAEGLRPVPWWRTSRGLEQIETRDGRSCLRTAPGEWAEQPLPAYAPLTGGSSIQGEVLGAGRLVLIDGRGQRHEQRFEAAQWESLRVPLPEGFLPRLTLRLEPDAEQTAHWRGLEAQIALPCPNEEALAREIAELIDVTVTPWLERALDDSGPRNTGFVAHVIDARDGSRLMNIPGGFHPLWEQLLQAARVHENPRWNAALQRFLEDWLTLGLDSETGLPRAWDPERDQPILDRPVEIALPLSFLIDVARTGASARPDPFSARARAAAIRIGETVLRHGLLPDGSIAASYFPSDARVNTGVVSLRAFDVPAQLARLTELTGDPRYAQAAGEALASFEFAHSWAGTWDKIDPAFDDEYGHFGARAVTIALAVPDDPLYRRFGTEAFAHFAPLWRDALRLGGNVAADQVRCWVLLADQQRQDSANRAAILELLNMALRSHFKGEQYGDGAWGDVTIFRFDPNSNLQVGDYSGAPMNLLHGLSALYALPEFRTDAVRGMYTAVLRSSQTAYQRPYGFLMERREREGANPAAGTLRMLLGLSKMLRALRTP